MERNRERPINHTTGLVELARTETPREECVSWFQAEQACALFGKRLLTNQEWQHAAAGTPDAGYSRDDADTRLMNLGGPGDGDGRCESTEQ